MNMKTYFLFLFFIFTFFSYTDLSARRASKRRKKESVQQECPPPCPPQTHITPIDTPVIKCQPIKTITTTMPKPAPAQKKLTRRERKKLQKPCPPQPQFRPGAKVTVTDSLSDLDTTLDDEKKEKPKKVPDAPFSQLFEKEEILLDKHKIPRPDAATNDPEDTVNVNFENADLSNILDWIADLFKISFLSDDNLNPVPERGGKKYTVADKKVTFKTHDPLTKKQVWDLFVTFLDLWGLAIKRSPVDKTIYEILPTSGTAPNRVTKTALPAIIGVPWKELPDNDQYARYVYFVKNTDLKSVYDIVNALRSNTAILGQFKELNAFILTDKFSNIRAIMKVVQELDKETMPEGLSVLRLKNADAGEVKKVYDELTKKKGPTPFQARVMGMKQVPTKQYFPENIRVLAELRTNSLILLGDQEGIKKIENFITEHVDTELRTPYSPLYIYDLQYADAENTAKILNEIVKFGQGLPAAQFGGVRGGDKYLQPMQFEAEPFGNRLLIKAEKEDYLKIEEIIKDLDVKQPQIAIEVLIVDITGTSDKQLGVQIRNKRPDSFVHNADFQTSGFPGAAGVKSGIITNPDTGSLVGNLVQLAQGQPPASTLISIGTDATSGVWGMFKILQSQTQTNIIANPYLVSTNKYTAKVLLGQTRRVVSQEVVAGSNNEPVTGFEDVSAVVSVQVTPQINEKGIINLDIVIFIEAFNNVEDPLSANKTSHIIRTNANIANQEILAIGGLLKEQEDQVTCKVPILGDIPILGWLFKSKQQIKTKDNILVFLSPRIVHPQPRGGLSNYSQIKMGEAKDDLSQLSNDINRRDPVHRWFFDDLACEEIKQVDSYVTRKKKEGDEYRDRIKRKKLSGVDVLDLEAERERKLEKRKRAKKKSLAQFVPDDQEQTNHAKTGIAV